MRHAPILFHYILPFFTSVHRASISVLRRRRGKPATLRASALTRPRSSRSCFGWSAKGPRAPFRSSGCDVAGGPPLRLPLKLSRLDSTLDEFASKPSLDEPAPLVVNKSDSRTSILADNLNIGGYQSPATKAAHLNVQTTCLGYGSFRYQSNQIKQIIKSNVVIFFFN